MNVKEVKDAILEITGKYVGDERELLEELTALAEGWAMRLEELDELDEEDDVY